jgi:tRNA pseudouridine55 synthase
MDATQFNGIIVVNKPGKITSAKVVALIKKTLQAKKVGHTGTLDPFAEGVLICCINQATRIARFLLKGKKTYVAVLKLGEETDTQDLTGMVLSTSRLPELPEQTIQSVFKSFEGTSEQLPPVYSALKHKGEPLYRFARRGRPVQKPARRIYIDGIRILDIDLPFVRFEVACSAGTYVRSLCADIGKALGCGGHLYALRRTQSSGFKLDQAITLAELDHLSQSGKLSQCIIPMSAALSDMQAFRADALLEEKIRHGKTITLRDLKPVEETNLDRFSEANIKILDLDNHLVAILKHSAKKQQLDYCCVFAKSDVSTGEGIRWLQ